MAAPMSMVEKRVSGVKLSKADRKTLKKQMKIRNSLFKRNGVTPVDYVTHHLVVANGGLDNNISHQDILTVFQEYGEVVDIVMQPQKSYAFVTMASKAHAISAFAGIHARCLEFPEKVESLRCVTFYLDYVDSVPGIAVPGTNLPPGLGVIEDFVTEDEEISLLNAVNWSKQDPQLSCEDGTMKHRRVKHYGYEFLYDVNNVDKDKPLGHGIPSACDIVIERILETGHVKFKPDQLTVNQYEPGQGIPPHIDTHSAFEDGIVSLSLGSQCVMNFRHPDGSHVPVVLPRRSVVIMTKESRYLWTHSITPRRSDIVVVKTGQEDQRLTLLPRGTRTSFTFRKVLRKPCTCRYPDQCDSQLSSISTSAKVATGLPESEEQAVEIEQQHVHKVYEQIAGHFSDTRHSPWPRVAAFLQRWPEGSVIADIGCGNGKYLSINTGCFKIGCDRSYNLCKICYDRGFPVFVADVLNLPFKSEIADVVISIAVIHHMSTQARRLEAVRELIRVLQIGGEALIYVWALEQERGKAKSNYLKDTRIDRKDWLKTQEEAFLSRKQISSTDTDVTDEHKLLNVDQVEQIGKLSKELSDCQYESELALSKEIKVNKKQERGNAKEACDGKRPAVSTVFSNEKAVQDSPCSTLDVHVNRTHFDTQDLLVPWHSKPQHKKSEHGTIVQADGGEGQQEKVVHRFYHVFREGELEDLCRLLPGVDIVDSYYDKGNWCVVLKKIS